MTGIKDNISREGIKGRGALVQSSKFKVQSSKFKGQS
jgi:hypothetical protein